MRKLTSVYKICKYFREYIALYLGTCRQTKLQICKDQESLLQNFKTLQGPAGRGAQLFLPDLFYSASTLESTQRTQAVQADCWRVTPFLACSALQQDCLCKFAVGSGLHCTASPPDCLQMSRPALAALQGGTALQKKVCKKLLQLCQRNTFCSNCSYKLLFKFQLSYRSPWQREKFKISNQV